MHSSVRYAILRSMFKNQNLKTDRAHSCSISQTMQVLCLAKSKRLLPSGNPAHLTVKGKPESAECHSCKIRAAAKLILYAKERMQAAIQGTSESNWDTGLMEAQWSIAISQVCVLVENYPCCDVKHGHGDVVA